MYCNNYRPVEKSTRPEEGHIFHCRVIQRRYIAGSIEVASITYILCSNKITAKSTPYSKMFGFHQAGASFPSWAKAPSASHQTSAKLRKRSFARAIVLTPPQACIRSLHASAFAAREDSAQHAALMRVASSGLSFMALMIDEQAADASSA